jgi:hypothetical protein
MPEVSYWFAITFSVVFTFAYFFVRREWVFRQRLTVIMRTDNIATYPEFNDMLFKYWWVWNVDKFPRN